MQDSGIEWLGEVPAHWGAGKLRYVTDLIQTGPFGSQLHASDYIENGLPVINPSNLVDGNIEPDWQKTITDEIADRLSRHRLSEGDIVFARRGEMGRCALVGSDEDGWLCGTGSIKVELQKESVDPQYMSVVLSTVGVSEWLELQSVGSTMSNLNTDILSAIPIPIPPRYEQEEIVEYISERSRELDQIIDRETKEIDLLQELRTSLISEAVTGKIDVRDDVPQSAEVAA
jgi:type I restriction enzyme S subunit